MQAAAEGWDGGGAGGTAGMSLRQASAEDAYWKRRCRRERYFRAGLGYEDYAPAYCVGYAGCVQYGGRFADAEGWLRANWERIKGDSRLALHDAVPAMRAAWDRMARLRARAAVGRATSVPA